MADPKVINYAGEQKIYNKEKVDELLDLKQDTLVPDIVVQDSVNVVTNAAVKAYVDAETQRAKSAEGNLNDLATTDKSNLVAAINEVKDSAYTVDEHVTAGSTNPVQNTGVKEYVDAQDVATLQSAKDYTDDKIGELKPGDGSTVVELTGHLGDLNNAAESLVTAINRLDTLYAKPDTAMSDTSENAVQNKVIKKYIDDRDTAPTKNSEKAVTSNGIWNATRFASVRVGETMYWHLQDDSSPENREVRSNNPFVFNFKGQEVSVETQNGNVQLCTLKDIPDGWHALDGKAELLATDYPDLASFMPENVTKDGKIWLPYVQHKIIKIKY